MPCCQDSLREPGYVTRRARCKRPAALGAVLVFGLGTPAPVLGQARFGQPVGREQEVGRLEPTAERAAQAPPNGPPAGAKTLNLSLQPPSREQLFKVESEDKLRARMEKEYLALGQKKVLFPRDDQVPFAGKSQRFPPPTAVLESANLCSNPLYFEEEDTERHGIYCPLAQPLISTARFYFNTLCLPLKMIVTPPWSLNCWQPSIESGSGLP